MSNRNHQRCGCEDRRPRGCLNSIGGLYGWNGSCGRPAWDRDIGIDRDPAREPMSSGLFTANLPLAVAANGVIPLNACGCDRSMSANNGQIALREPGTYLATVTARVPEGSALDTTVTLNANDASQQSALLVLSGAGPVNASSQALFEVCDRTTVSLRSSEAINATEASPQPVFTLSLVRVD